MKKPHQFSAILVFSLFMAFNGFAMQKTSTHQIAEDLALASVNESSTRAAETVETVQQTKGPRFGETPEDSIHCIRNLSLYQEYYNQGNRQLAFKPWREVFFNCPQASQNTFIRGSSLIKMKYSEETDPVRREAWIDTLMMVHDKRIEHFNRKGYVLGRKAVDLFQLRPNSIMEIYEISSESIALEGKKSEADVLLINFQSLIRLEQSGLKEVSEILTTFEKTMEIIEHNLQNNPQDKRFYEPAKANIESLFEPYATCENIVTLYGPQFEKNPENIELLEKITSMLDKAGCSDSELFYHTTLKLHNLKPTAESAFLMGRMENSAENYTRAINYFQQAVDLYENDEDKFTALLMMSDISYRQLRQFSQARSYALQAAEFDPNNGRPYLLIGEMYAASSSQCGDNDLSKAAVYWVAVDKFVQARNVAQDDIVKERATELINTYSQYFPNKELTFFHGLSEGDTYRVNCWINETTRVR